jgi:hypothetical protein
MDVKNDKLLIQSTPYDLETGEKLEPEAVPAARVLVGSAAVTGRQDGAVLGQIPTSMRREADTIEFANQARSRCVNCKHFDQVGYRDWARSPEGQRCVPEMKAALAQGFGLGIDDAELDHAMNFLGICRIFTEIGNEVSITRPDYSCPAASESNPLGFWDAITSGDEQIASSNYDHILRVAQGKK